MIVFNAHSCWEVRLQVDRKNILDTCPIGKMSYFDSDVYVCMHTGTIATQQLLAELLMQQIHITPVGNRDD